MLSSLVEVKDSNCIKALGYDPASDCMYVQFCEDKSKKSKKGTDDSTLYIYPNVKKELFAEFQSHPKKGKFFAEIKRSLSKPQKIKMDSVEFRKVQIRETMKKNFKKK